MPPMSDTNMLSSTCGRYGHEGGRYGHEGGRYGHEGRRYGHDGGRYGHEGGRYGHEGGRYGHACGRYRHECGRYGHACGRYGHVSGAASHASVSGLYERYNEYGQARLDDSGWRCAVGLYNIISRRLHKQVDNCVHPYLIICSVRRRIGGAATIRRTETRFGWPW
eukprot:421039-Prorocentrum_minimum.AAC.1